MKIACLCWGSLYWSPRKLLVDGNWKSDGPQLPLEFARSSNDKRLTLVITPGASLQTTLWAIMTTDDLDTAIESLRSREGIPIAAAQRLIGVLKLGDCEDSALKSVLMAWLKAHEIDAVIWTDLPPKFNGKTNQTPTLEEAIHHLKSLKGLEKDNALEYIKKAPRQIETVYRSAFNGYFHS